MTRLTDYEKFKSKQQSPKIIWLYGQPGSGKTTISKYLEGYFKTFKVPCFSIDGDDLRYVTDNIYYDRIGRENNIRNARTIAKFLMHKGNTVIVSLVTPYRNARDEFASENAVHMVHLYKSGVGDRDHFKVPDFEGPSKGDLIIDTTKTSIDETCEKVLNFVLYGA
jgi:adenylylsulfate kinase-like enzyme